MYTRSMNRRFGWLLAGVFAVAAGYAWYRHRGPLVSGIWLGAALILLAISLWLPDALAPFNRAWHRFSELLGRVVSPVVLGLLYFLMLTPVGWLRRLFGRDELRLRRPGVDSYWCDRSPPGPAADSFSQQF